MGGVYACMGCWVCVKGGCEWGLCMGAVGMCKKWVWGVPLRREGVCV